MVEYWDGSTDVFEYGATDGIDECVEDIAAENVCEL